MDARPSVPVSDADSSEPGGLGRIEAFSDGVFAIAITLLILEIRLPHETASTPSGGGHAQSLWLALASLWPSYLAYVLSFVIIGIMWANHRNLFRYLARADHLFVMINLALLLFISFIPFPTAVLADHLRDPENRVAATAFYGASFLPMSIIYNVLWRYAASGHRLLRADVNLDHCAYISREYLLGPIFYAVATALAFLNPWISLSVHGLLALVYVVPHKARP